MAQDLIAYFDARFQELAQQVAESREGTTQQIEKLREETISRFEKGEETARHTEILIEDLRHKLDVVAEGVVGANERLDRYRSEARIEFNQAKGWIAASHLRIENATRASALSRQDCPVAVAPLGPQASLPATNSAF